MKKYKIFWIFFVIFWPLLAPAAVIHVPGDQPTLQAGIDAASARDTVLAADGVYGGDGNRDLVFRGKAILVRSQNGAEHCIIDCGGSASEPHRGFYLRSGEGQDSVIQGFTIKNGYAAGQSDLAQCGGAVFCYETSPTIRNNRIIENSVEGGGGGIFCYGHSSPVITGNTVSQNTADVSGGGILIHFFCSAIVMNNTISGNVSKDYGGAGICCKNTSAPKIMNNIITGNFAEDYGGGIRSSHCASVIRNNLIAGNHAGYYGGGIFYFFTDDLIGDNIIKENTAFRDGGGIFCHESSPPMINNLIAGNTAIGSGGAIFCRSASSPQIINNTVTGNAARNPGGGLACSDRSRPVVSNSIFWHNTPEEIDDALSLPVISFSDVEGGYPGSGNIDGDPHFTEGREGSFYLSQTPAGQFINSPCVEAGNPAAGLMVGTTRTDAFQDDGVRDMGYHYPGRGDLVFGPGPGIDNPPEVRVFPAEPDAGVIHNFDAYGPRHYGVNIACWDGDGDGFDQILTGPGPGYLFGPHVKGFTAAGSSISGINFLAYGTRHYGVLVGAGDLDGDGFEEIMTGPGPGAIFGPHVRAFSYAENGDPAVTPVPGVNFMAYGTCRWGVNITCGDIDGDRRDEILTGPGPGPQFSPHVRGWNIDGRPVEAMGDVSFLAYGFRKSGVRVASGDVDGDGYDEIITAPGPSPFFGAHVSGWNYDHETIAPLAGFSFLAWPPSEVRYGARVFSGADLDALGRDELVVGAGPDPSSAAMVKIYRYQNTGVTEWLSMQAFPSQWTHGAAVAAGKF